MKSPGHTVSTPSLTELGTKVNVQAMPTEINVARPTMKTHTHDMSMSYSVMI